MLYIEKIKRCRELFSQIILHDEEKKKKERKIICVYFQKHSTSDICTIYLNKNSLVGEVKEILYESVYHYLTPSIQRFIFGGRQLADEKKISEYGVVEGSLVYVFEALRGD